MRVQESASLEAEPEDEPEAGEITMPKPGRVQSGAELRVASQPKLEEVIRVPPPKQPESSNSSSGISGQREANKESLADTGADSPGHRHSRRSKKRSLRHSPDWSHTSWELHARSSSRERITRGGRHKQKASSSRKRRRRSPSSEESHGSMEAKGRNGCTDKKQHRSADSSENKSDGGREGRKAERCKTTMKAKKKGHRRHADGHRRSDDMYVLCCLFLSFQLLTDQLISPRSFAAFMLISVSCTTGCVC